MGERLPAHAYSGDNPIYVCELVKQSSLEPHIHNAATVAIEVMKTDKSVEVIEDDSTHHNEIREPQIDRDAATAISRGTSAPIGYATAVCAKMKTDRPTSPGIDPSGARYSDALIFVVIGPERSIASADRAVAGGGQFRGSGKTPADGAAMTATFDHPICTSFAMRRPYQPPPALEQQRRQEFWHKRGAQQ